MNLSGQHILLGVTGGIAAYKAPDLVRRLRQAGAEVRVVLTAGAQAFVTPLTFQAVSHQPVHTDLLDPEAEAGMGHLELARWADRVIIAPASADAMARLAHGLAGDLLTTLCLATRAPITVCPAMNHVMWQAAATVANTETLRRRGVDLLGPMDGPLAEGESGPGRLMEPADIVTALTVPGDLAGRAVVITAGPTREPIDAVRFIANRSSGRMGFAIAAAAAAAGARVILVAGPTALATPPGVTRIDVETAVEMHAAALHHAADSDLFIAAAAVADYRVAAPADHKVRKADAPPALELVPNPDIVREVAAMADGPFTVGFAAETHDVIDHARDKLTAKDLDMIAANQVGAGLGFEVGENTLEVIWPTGRKTLGPMTKERLGEALLALIGERFHAAR
ncbi:bifunctional phosphopantothenoylcysteine decarboxylase/phosphopantothenate--cysteine ligase CoaBC [Spiribacter vilamensis]|uniref:Coenzyme A biosynthesis bifunctional protein CoaBC n=1 Tax=Spiribacter vilamensis TaxID=531306 RepID=A0A4Q8D1W1_9GAMM|nr:bifunctional phosphopantothenoylcysteine decarboxylase/phosphopantothenate--cysteine ligase CoaBC [Spiribacter vilamensis]RZU99323.1 phosphopantothenoylcysteine decarboxylase/phosphopantothenate--cysteine ligase [Spiribacter vilamensis]TVO61693.1 bifunctional phosphopantothenoylcysteine decarboxylase/phosphopantothenate--cysteine ligase CoaBC [Spiribacter vilamensis]